MGELELRPVNNNNNQTAARDAEGGPMQLIMSIIRNRAVIRAAISFVVAVITAVIRDRYLG